ncbi:OmpL47-type beta-barrel domain-containing protein [Paenibacillus sp. GCM10027629]|uniref:OmpL47-type beta-barrel domain-containing protein n=1 Tax=Paenibacillus sp. GCM10027629 TaxID=3273414 RepID=UPI0036251552
MKWKSRCYRVMCLSLISALLFSAIATVTVPKTARAASTEVYVATDGDDNNTGTITSPFRTLAKAQSAVRDLIPSSTGPIHIWVRGGTYYLDRTLVFNPQDSGQTNKPVIYSAYEGEKVILSGGKKLTPTWRDYQGGIKVADIGAGLDFDGLFLNSQRQILARYPNYDPNVAILGGYAADALAPSRVAKWSDPTTGLVRGLHGNEWGGNSFKITGVNASNGSLNLQWVGDNNRGSTLHATYRMVENIFEELDAPGEWFYDSKGGKLYFNPPTGTDLNKANIEIAVLDELLRITGTATDKVKHLTFSNFTFTETHRTLFNKPYAGLMRGDWSVARTGTVFVQDAENISIQNSVFDQVGGNAIFVNGYNRNHQISNNEFSGSGATDVQIVGLQSAVRYPSTWSNQHTDIQDTTPGPLTNDYPQNITVNNNHMFNMGVFEKQSAGVNVSVSRNITISHNTIHHSPRSGVNINDGTWGGHVIEFNDIFDCVLETSDHGPFNAWGRDRFWSLSGGDAVKKQYAFLDAMETTVIRNNRIWHNSAWDIDLDDGSSNYDIYNNLMLNAGFKLREGFSRKVHNNIIVNGGGHFHVAYAGSNDVIEKNIFVTDNPYDFIQDDPKAAGTFYDNNTFWNNGKAVADITSAWMNSGFDTHSVIADPLFVGASPFTDVSKKDFTVQAGSPAIAREFVNFPMNQFGKPGAPTPPGIKWSTGNPTTEADIEPLMGAEVSSIYSDAVMSSVGLGDTNGLYFYQVPADSNAKLQGLQQGDVLRQLNGEQITTKSSFWNIYNRVAPGGILYAQIWRNQASISIQWKKLSGNERLNDTAGVEYTGTGWDYKNAARGGANSYYNDLYATQTNGDFFEFTFHGTGIDYIAQVNSDEGDVDIYIDNVFQQTISNYNPSRIYQKVVFSKQGLTPGIHIIKGVKKNSSYLIVDGFNVYGAATSDIIAPVTTAQTNPAVPDGENGSFTKDVTLSLSASDSETGVARIEYRINDGEWTKYKDPILLTQEGKNTVHYRSMDYAGNQEKEQILVISIDRNVNPSKELRTELVAPQAIASGERMTVQVHLKSIQDAVYAQDIELKYDEKLLDYISAAASDTGLQIVSSSLNEPGKLRFIIASTGADHAVTQDSKVLTVTFQAKIVSVEAMTQVSVYKAVVADQQGKEFTAQGSMKTIGITVPQGVPGDLNHDGKVTIGDLAIAATSYGKSASDPNWPQIKAADLNHDGVVDIADLAAIATLILNR